MNPFNYDFNHDGKLDKEDDYLFYEITEGDDSEKQEPVPQHSSGKAKVSAIGWIILIFSAFYIDAFFKGKLGFNILSVPLAIICILVSVSLLFNR